MPAIETLRSSRDFHRVRSRGTRARSDGVTVWVCGDAPGSVTRVGLSPRSRSSVERNRIRRRLRSAWREVAFEGSQDVVIAADRIALDASFQELVNHVRTALSRAAARS